MASGRRDTTPEREVDYLRELIAKTGARAVMALGGPAQGPILLAGAGADRFCENTGLAQRVPSSLCGEGVEPISRSGTVGAVAVDQDGHLAAATSTGGRLGKLPGRVGDSPIAGAGTWADDRTVAVSATGEGESFLVAGFAHRNQRREKTGIRRQRGVGQRPGGEVHCQQRRSRRPCQLFGRAAVMAARSSSSGTGALLSASILPRCCAPGGAGAVRQSGLFARIGTVRPTFTVAEGSCFFGAKASRRGETPDGPRWQDAAQSQCDLDLRPSRGTSRYQRR